MPEFDRTWIGYHYLRPEVHRSPRTAHVIAHQRHILPTKRQKLRLGAVKRPPAPCAPAQAGGFRLGTRHRCASPLWDGANQIGGRTGPPPAHILWATDDVRVVRSYFCATAVHISSNTFRCSIAIGETNSNIQRIARLRDGYVAHLMPKQCRAGAFQHESESKRCGGHRRSARYGR